jgi:hypothetical protein
VHALDAGIDPTVIVAIGAGTAPDFQDEESQIVTKSLLEDHSVPSLAEVRSQTNKVA